MDHVAVEAQALVDQLQTSLASGAWARARDNGRKLLPLLESLQAHSDRPVDPLFT